MGQIIVVAKGKNLFEDMAEIVNAIWIMALAPSAIFSIVTIVFEYLSKDLDPNNMGKFNHVYYDEPHSWGPIDLTPNYHPSNHFSLLSIFDL